MGVEYKHYLIPEDNTYKPPPEELSRLVRALLEGGFVAETGTDAVGRMTFETYTTYEHAERTGCYVHLGNRTYSSFPCPCSEQDIATLGEKDFKLVWPVESTNESGLNPNAGTGVRIPASVGMTGFERCLPAKRG